MRKAILLMFVLAISRAPSAAQSVTDGNALLQDCSIVVRGYDGANVTTSLENLNEGTCMGLLRGIADTMALWGSLDHGPVDASAFHGCLPDSLKTIQLARIVVKYLNDHPEKLHLPDTRLVMMALADAFPCKQNP